MAYISHTVRCCITRISQ